jgi:hypothetical protein
MGVGHTLLPAGTGAVMFTGMFSGLSLAATLQVIALSCKHHDSMGRCKSKYRTVKLLQILKVELKLKDRCAVGLPVRNRSIVLEGTRDTSDLGVLRVVVTCRLPVKTLHVHLPYMGCTPVRSRCRF